MNDMSCECVNGPGGCCLAMVGCPAGVSGPTTQSYSFAVDEGAATLMASIVATDGNSIPPGVSFQITDPNGVIYNAAQVTDATVAQEVNGLLVSLLVDTPPVGTWTAQVTCQAEPFWFICNVASASNGGGNGSTTLQQALTNPVMGPAIAGIMTGTDAGEEIARFIALTPEQRSKALLEGGFVCTACQYGAFALGAAILICLGAEGGIIATAGVLVVRLAATFALTITQASAVKWVQMVAGYAMKDICKLFCKMVGACG